MAKIIQMGDIGRELSQALRNAADAEIKAFDEAYRATTVNVLSKVLAETPVDTGRLRGAWVLDQNYNSGDVGRVSKNKGANYIKQKTQGGMVGKKFYFFNNLPYAEVVEYGRYPNPVKKGSKRRKQRGFVKYSSGGFSKQAPEGMLRKNLMGFYSKLESAWRARRGRV